MNSICTHTLKCPQFLILSVHIHDNMTVTYKNKNQISFKFPIHETIEMNRTTASGYW